MIIYSAISAGLAGEKLSCTITRPSQFRTGHLAITTGAGTAV